MHRARHIPVHRVPMWTRCAGTEGRYFNKLLVANRGEIACRVMQTCQRLGIPTVAVYSTADVKSKHVAMADEAYCIGPPPSAESYLQIPKIMEVIKATGVDAVHPGYGFLSENYHFSATLQEAGVEFVGPTERAIKAMGDKIESKKLAAGAGVSTIPGYQGEITSEEQLLQVANEIGYPVMLKASSGGGGKGMRVAGNDKEALEGFHSASAEALAAFGDDRMLVEKFVEEPRHIEIQIIGDKLGNIVWLPERECSIQRRNQKVIEEAPSTFLDPATRKAMGEQAVMLAKSVDYHTAGTVEMMVDRNKNFYFLEMNTRLQVEHPITELITGVDLVEQMIRAAAGQPLSIQQSEVTINGWATECRVYAEDPLNNFLPVIGRLNRYREPTHVEGVRVDSGILEGSEISVFYDPLISKLTTWANTREESLQRMATALDSYVIQGSGRNNVNFLRDLMTHPRYVSGNITTKFIEEEFPTGYKGHQLTTQERNQVLAVGGIVHTIRNNMLDTTKSTGTYKWVVKQDDTTHVLQCTKKSGDTWTVEVAPLGAFDVPDDDAELLTSLEDSCHDGASFVAYQGDAAPLGGTSMDVTLQWDPSTPLVAYTIPDVTEGLQYIQVLGRQATTYALQFMGSQYHVTVHRPLEHHFEAFMPPPDVVDATKVLQSPMPGVVVEVLVQPGDKVQAGTPLLTLEAMKMRNVLSAVGEGTVKEVCVELGARVEDDEELVLFE